MLSDFLTANDTFFIQGQRLYLRSMQARDVDAWIALRTESQDYLKPWEPTWAPNALSREAFRRRLKYFTRTARDDNCYALLIFRITDDILIGGLTMNNVRRGVTQSASLGYWIGQPYAGKHFMTEAVVATVKYAFLNMGLHRVEAACLSDNEPSARVLINAGFREEGFARAYRRINGEWQDHRLFGIINGDPLPAFEMITGRNRADKLTSF